MANVVPENSLSTLARNVFQGRLIYGGVAGKRCRNDHFQKAQESLKQLVNRVGYQRHATFLGFPPESARPPGADALFLADIRSPQGSTVGPIDVSHFRLF